MKLAIHYFSATGNTARAVELIRKFFAAMGWETSLHPIEKGTRPPQAEADLTLVAFPTLSFDMPSFVASYLKKLKPSPGSKAAVFATYGGDPYGALQRAAALLKRRGFAVVSTGGAAYPDNWTQMMNPPVPEKVEQRIAAGDAAAVAYAESLLAGKGGQHPAKATLVSKLTAILFRSFGRRFLGLCFIADGRCTGCDLCARTCPTGTIAMAGRKRTRPRWGFTCADCGRCINICPTAAIQTSILLLILHIAANAAIIYGFIRAIRPVDAFAAGLADGAWRVGLDILLLAAGAAAALWVEAVPFQRLLAWLGRRRGLAKILGMSFTTKFRRYQAPGFKVAE